MLVRSKAGPTPDKNKSLEFGIWDAACSIAMRAVSQSNISATRLRGFPIPLPSLFDQVELVRAEDAFDAKIELHQAELASLQDLFRALLHELMTAKIRVHQLDNLL
jgi:type I restriction enzyme S subunit